MSGCWYGLRVVSQGWIPLALTDLTDTKRTLLYERIWWVESLLAKCSEFREVVRIFNWRQIKETQVDRTRCYRILWGLRAKQRGSIGVVKYGLIRKVLMDKVISPRLLTLNSQNHKGDSKRNMWSKNISVTAWEGMNHPFICVFSRYILNFEA